MHADTIANAMSYRAKEIVPVFLVNNDGEQIAKALRSIADPEDASYYSPEMKEELKQYLAAPEGYTLWSYFMPIILEVLEEFRVAEPKVFYYESALAKHASQFFTDHILKYCSPVDRGYTLDDGVRQFFLVKRNGQNTYLLNDLFLQYSLKREGFDASFVATGTDHTDHQKKLKYCVDKFVSPGFYRPVVIGRLSFTDSQGQELSFSKRKRITEVEGLNRGSFRRVALSLPTSQNSSLSPTKIVEAENR